jgi:hypothetical protein
MPMCVRPTPNLIKMEKFLKKIACRLFNRRIDDGAPQQFLFLGQSGQ